MRTSTREGHDPGVGWRAAAERDGEPDRREHQQDLGGTEPHERPRVTRGGRTDRSSTVDGTEHAEGQQRQQLREHERAVGGADERRGGTRTARSPHR